MKMIQIDPPLPLFVIDKGTGYAHFLIDYGIEDHLYWVIFMDNTGECWTVANPQIRMQNNPTLGRHNTIANLKESAKYDKAIHIGGSPFNSHNNPLCGGDDAIVKIYDGVLNSPCTL